MSDDDDALGQANKFLAVRQSTEIATIDNDAIAALLEEAEEATRPREPPRPVETKPQPQSRPQPVQEPPRNPPPAVATRPTVAVQSQTPGAFRATRAPACRAAYRSIRHRAAPAFRES